jgi:hypothetical protein
MPLLRLLFAGLIALAAMAAVAFTAMVVLITGMAGWIAQRLRGKPVAAPRAPAPTRRSAPRMHSDDVIDVVTTNVPDDSGQR